MKRTILLTLAALASLAAGAGPAVAADAPGATVTPAFRNAITNVPGKVLTAVVVSYPPGGKTPSHRHAKSAFITAYVLSGQIRSQVDDGPVTVFKPGDSWFETPGAHHRVSENASATEPASLLAVFVVDAAETDLTTLDPR